MTNKTAKKIIIHSVCAFIFSLPLNTFAHPVAYKAISTDFLIHENSISFLTRVQHIFEYNAPTPTATKKLLSAYFAAKLKISTSSGLCTTKITGYESDTLAAISTFEGTYICPETIDSYGELSITSTIFEEFFEQFDHYIEVRKDSQIRNIILNRTNTKFDDALFEPIDNLKNKDVSAFTSDESQPTQEPLLKVIRRFTVLGIEHIVFGFDHILFLVAAILLLSSLRSIALIVTSFTISHSFTLILAGLGLITLSPRITEPIIALSIAYLAAQNIWNIQTGTQERFRQRFITTFGFGLIHGLGLAGALKEIVIPKNYFLPALLTFNVGIEIGQIGLLILFMPMLKYVEIKNFSWRHLFLILISFIIMLMALWWFIERILYGI